MSLSSRRNSSQKPRNAGFTLVEILLVFGLISMLVYVLVINADRIFGGGQEDAAKIFVGATLEPALTSYRIHNGKYPSTEEGLKALMSAPSSSRNWKGPYLKNLPDDPWGNPYQYQYPGSRNKESYDAWSMGPDGVASDDDIGNWESQ